MVSIKQLSCLCIFILFASCGRADVRLPNIISDGMVLQQKTAAPIWGKAAPGEKVTVTCDKVPAPKFVRMGWLNVATPNLQDKSGIPVFPFPSKEVE